MVKVLIPCFRRAEFLHHSLRNIEKAEGAELHHFIFALDHGYDPEVLRVTEGFTLSKEIRYTPRTRYTIGKQSFNVLYNLPRGEEYTILIEEDVIVGRDFFQWHAAVHDQGHLFSAHANLNVNSAPREGMTDEYYLTSRDYGSIGVSLSGEAMEHIAPHINGDYFADPVRYIRKHFPDSWLGYGFSEQDGLIRRIQAQTDLPQAYPCHLYLDGNLYGPRCYHAGYVGKNRPRTGITGSLESRIAQVGATIYDTSIMRAACGTYAGDSVPCALELPQWDELRLKN